MKIAGRLGPGLPASIALACLCHATAFCSLQRHSLFPLTGSTPHEFRGRLEAGAQQIEAPVSCGHSDCRCFDAELAPLLGAFLRTQGILPTP